MKIIDNGKRLVAPTETGIQLLKINNYLSQFLKKSISIVLSVSIIYTQLLFTFLIYQATVSSINHVLKENNFQFSIFNFQLAQSAEAKAYNGFSRRGGSSSRNTYENSSSQYTPNAPLHNIRDNPIDYISIDNTISDGTNNGNCTDPAGCMGGTFLDRTENGTPQININNATQGGVSANYYRDFNVTVENVILNNHKGEAVGTYLGGVIYGNPNFNQTNGREADIILNEITSNRQTRIEGYIEVAGKKADVIIANSNGIMVSGGGFINTAKLSMITGSSLNTQTGTSFDSNGNLNPFQLNQDAKIEITNGLVAAKDEHGNDVSYNIGLDVTNSDYLALISRIVNIDGDIIGSNSTEVNIKTGNNTATFNTTTKEFDVDSISTTESENTKPIFSIDSTALGGIYAGKINIIATEKGVGVRTRSDVVAYVDDLNFDVNGNIILENANLQALGKNAKVSINNKNQSPTAEEILNNTDKYKLEINNSTIYAGNVDKTDSANPTYSGSIEINTDNLENKNNSVIQAVDSLDINTIGSTANGTDSITNTTGSTIFAYGDIRLKSTGLSNVGGEITGYGNIDIDLFTDFITEGLMGSTYGTTTITAKSITIDNGTKQDTNNINNGNDIKTELTGYNLVLRATAGDITNTSTSTLTAENNIIFDALTAVVNNGTISAGNNLSIAAGERIINYGSLQAIGVPYEYTDGNGNTISGKYSDTGNVTLITKASTNSDYKLNDLAKTIDDMVIVPLTQDTQDKINNINNIADKDELNELLLTTLNTNNEAEYYIVQSRIRYLSIQELIQLAKEHYIFDSDNFTLDKMTTIEEEIEQIDEHGNPLKDGDGNTLYTTNTYERPLTEADIQEQLKELLGETEYNNTIDDWQIDDTLTGEDLKDALEERLTKIETIYTTLQKKLTNLSDNVDWNNLSESELKNAMGYFYSITNDTASYKEENWSLTEFDTTSGNLNEYTKYLLQLRTDNMDTQSTEQTGIHNYGRIYSNNNMTLTSNSVLHNNEDSLIYSNGNITFNIADILFNNAGGTKVKVDQNGHAIKDEDGNIVAETAIGYGIISKGSIAINGTNSELSRLNKLINYDGRIEADNNITIRTNETINYGSDNINYFTNPYAAVSSYYAFYGMPAYSYNGNTTKKYGEIFYYSILTSNQSQIVSNNGSIDIDSNDRITNYNSVIYAKDSIALKTDELFNTIAEFTVSNVEFWARGRKKKSKLGRTKNYMEYHPNRYYASHQKSTNGEARIVSQGSVVITSNSINNGTNFRTTTQEENQTPEEVASKLPYASTPTPHKSLLDKVIDTGILDLSTVIKLPTNNNGIFRKATDPNTSYLYETDPLLIDITRFLGSQYFLNRLGLDPFSIDQKFLGDAYMEHTMIKTYLEQVGFFQNNRITDEEIDTYINNLFETLTIEKMEELGLELGKELTKEQISKLTEDTVWYVSKTITLPDGTTTDVLVPQVYLCQDSVNKLLKNTQAHAEMQAQLSKKQAQDKAIQDSTNAGNRAIDAELAKISTQARQEAKNSITQTDRNTATANTNTLIQNNQTDYENLVQSYLDSYRQAAGAIATTRNKVSLNKVSLGSNRNDTNSSELYVYVDPNSEAKCTTPNSLGCITSIRFLTSEEALQLAKEQAYNDIYTNELAKIEDVYYAEIYKPLADDFYNAETVETINGTMQTMAEAVYQTAYNNTYQPTYDTALAIYTEQNSAKMETTSMIAGNNVYIQGKSPNSTPEGESNGQSPFGGGSSILNNSGTIQGNRQVVITVDQVNNFTASMNRTNTDGNGNATSTTKANQATIIAGDLIYLNTMNYKTDTGGNPILDENGNRIFLSTGQVNNISGMIGTLNQDSLTYLATGELNNITNSRVESYKIYESIFAISAFDKNRQEKIEQNLDQGHGNLLFEETRTHIGTTAQIASMGNILIDTQYSLDGAETGNVNFIGSSIYASNTIQMTIAGNLTSTTVQNYSRDYSYSDASGGAFGTDRTTEIDKVSIANQSSSIIANTGDLNISTGNSLISIGTNFSAGNDINLDIANSIYLLNAMDSDYSYYYRKEEKFDLGSAVANIAAAVAVAAVTGGAGAAAMAGVMAGAGAVGMTTGSITVDMEYHETTVASNLIAGTNGTGNININAGNDITMVSTNIISTSQPFTENNPNITDILDRSYFTLNYGGTLTQETAIEQHQSFHDKQTWGGDIGRAALGGAITGLASGIAVPGGEALGKLAGNALTNTFAASLSTAAAAATNAATISFSTQIGSAMSQTAIYGGNLGDILRAGTDAATSKDTLKSVVISGATAGITAGTTNYLNNLTNGALLAGNTATATIGQQLTTALYESASSNLISTAVQSTINGDSFTDALKHQLVNTIVMAGANLGAKQIGRLYHGTVYTDANGNAILDANNNPIYATAPSINKATQLTLHAGLGAATAALTGNDALSGAISGVAGEIFAELYSRSVYEIDPNNPANSSMPGQRLTPQQENTLKEIGGLTGGMTALITGKLTNQNNQDIIDNMFAGQRIGKNAVENNMLFYAQGTNFGNERTEKENEADLKTGRKLADGLGDTGDVVIPPLSLENTEEARKEVAEWIVNYLKENPLKEGEMLNLAGFSNGGNSIKEATWLLDALGYKVDNIVFLATPHTSAHQLNYDVMSGNGNIYNFYGVNDKVQDWFGGISFDSLPKFTSQTINNSGVINIQINQNPIRNSIIDNLYYITPTISDILKIRYMQNTHTNIHSDNTLDKYVLPTINKVNGN